MRRIFSLLLACLLVCTIAMTTFASEVLDLSKNGKITVKMECGGKPLDGGSLSIYQVGEIVEDKNGYRFELIDELKESGLSLDKLDDPRLARQLDELKKDLERITAPIRKGKAVFRDLKPGVYLVTQRECDTSRDAGAISPFLISMPIEEDGVYNYDVTAAPKVPQELDPTWPTCPEPTYPDPTYPTCPEPTYPDPTWPTCPEPTYPDPTWPTCPEPTYPDPTYPTCPEPTYPDPTNPTNPEPTDPKPTDPNPPEPDSTQPKPTDPEPTGPKPTQPAPDEPKLPQTGQLNWPVPIFVVAGLTLFVIGWILRFGRKKEQYEE